MIPIFASEKTFIEDIVLKPELSSTASFFRYALRAEELLDILRSNVDAASPVGQFLTGLLRDKRLIPINKEELNQNLPKNLKSTHNDYIPLSLRCNSKFIHKLNIEEDDLREFIKYGIDVITYNNIQYNNLMSDVNSNVIIEWKLADGGKEKLSSHALRYIQNVEHIKIYDRYFKRESLDAIKELFSTYSGAFGRHTARITLYIGSGLKGGITISDIQTEMHGYVDISKLNISTCDRTNNTNPHIHDRYMQIDNSYTFEFSSGLSCYHENNGNNRHSSVLLRTLVCDYSTFELLDNAGHIVQFRH